MSAANRSDSPITKKLATNKRNSELIKEDGKIHRIRLNAEATCKLAYLESPNLIWFKLINEISDKLQLTKPSRLWELSKVTPMVTLKLYDYVMAPLDEDIYARSRIVQLKQWHGNTYAFVHFIDEGFGEWVNVKCLAAMQSCEPVDKKRDPLFEYPWQAIPVALFKSLPGRHLDSLEVDECWSEDVTAKLREIMDKYDFFRVVPVCHAQKVNTYFEYARAEIYGLSTEKDPDGESIAHCLSLEVGAPCASRRGYDMDVPLGHLNRDLFDAQDQKLIDPGMVVFTEATVEQIPYFRHEFPVDFDGGVAMIDVKEKVNKMSEDDNLDDLAHFELLRKQFLDWDKGTQPGRCAEVAPMNIERLCRDGYMDPRSRECKFCVEWKSVKSPYEFYAYPMKIGQKKIKDLFQEEQKWARQLDAFYGSQCNRWPIDPVDVRNALQKGMKVFGIWEHNDEISKGCYKRVELLAVQHPNAADYSNEFCRIRFLDVGGSDIVPLAGLLAIHSIHCEKPPMCLQLKAHTIIPPPDGEESEDGKLRWPEYCIQKFRQFARSDVPMSVIIDEQTGEKVVRYETPSHQWPGALKVRNMLTAQDNLPVEHKMVDAKRAQFPTRISNGY
ncbi:Tudor domain containing protein [Ditylenchus destructor]|uniref:Tudor domain containing protein n=1 Tax=Ditylenchus destructor TaxID=166010 RepID=A0AAD4MZN8_9BILA|nr:Tudor domain containing protein [Ditylenchus destructor]